IRTPIPLGDHNIAFQSRWARRNDLRRFTGLNTVRPIRKHLQSKGPIQAGGSATHTVAANSRLQPIVPGFNRSLEFGLRREYVGQIARDSISKLMAEIAARFE